MDIQEIFDKVCEHLMTQKAKSFRMVGDREVCLYKAENGMSCAVGCLIPDDKYVPEMEQKGVEDLYKFCNKNGIVLDFFESIDDEDEEDNVYHLLMELQYIHDNVDISKWKESLKNQAVLYKLETPKCIMF